MRHRTGLPRGLRAAGTVTRDRGTGTRLLAVFLVAELALAGTSLLFALLLSRAGWSPAEVGQPLWPLPLLLVVPALVAVLVAAGGLRLVGGGPRPGRVRREWAGVRRDVLVGAAFGAGGLLLVVPAAAMWSAWTDGGGSAAGHLLDGREPGLGAGIAIFLTVWLIAPIAEEVLFRGVLWRALEHWGCHRWVVFAVTTAAFALSHLEWQRTPLLVVVAIPIGLARLCTGTVTAAIAAHQFNNFLPALATLLTGFGVLD
ncbi:CPBP family intramembrane glutamic endopeptidase [Actinosynnema sp. NPDC023587]|uniref:CPBP family intramembrane glutamic endopeptidase n=1 Tax=Actinosynnema sp. NPDC023587 TaxID=3154695 RepID=UPI0033FE2485